MAAEPAAPGSWRSRRSILRAGLAGLAGLAAGAFGGPSRARAAAGDPLDLGGSNDAGTSNTTLSTHSIGTALYIYQYGTGTALRGQADAGIAGFFTSFNGAGVSGVTANKDKIGVYAGNDAAATGTGCAMRANGKQNSGLVATADSADAFAVRAIHNSTSEGTAILGLTHANNPSRGVEGYADATTGSGVGVAGHVDSAGGSGVLGWNSAGGRGVVGMSFGNGIAVGGYCDGGTGVEGWASSTSASGTGVSGRTDSSTGVGVHATNQAAATGTGAALLAEGSNNNGVVATAASTSAYAVKAQNTSTSSGARAVVGLIGTATTASIPAWLTSSAGAFVGTCGVVGVGVGGAYGIVGVGVTGMYGTSAAPNGTGIEGYATDVSGATSGVFGHVDSPNGIGVYGQGGSGTGVGGSAGSGRGVRGLATSGVGVRGEATATSGANYGVYGLTGSAAGYGVYSEGNAYVHGAMQVTGSMSKGSGSFKIDHPLDPANKYLYHSFVESPDMLNVYSGTVTLDKAGEATVGLPAWFEALNRDFRYQLTPIGPGAPDLHVRSEVRSGQFSIGGGLPGQRVCWMVTGIRRDAFAEAHRIPVEETKPEGERGLYLHPIEHGQPKEKGIAAVREAAARK